MSQLRFDRSSLIINVLLLRAALEVIVPVSAVPTRPGFDFYTWWEKTPLHLPNSPTFPLSVYLPYYFLSLCLCFEYSRRGLTFAFTHFYTHTHTHGSDCQVTLQSDWDTVVGMCHLFIIDQIQLPSSTDHSEIHWLLFLPAYCHLKIQSEFLF